MTELRDTILKEIRAKLEFYSSLADAAADQGNVAMLGEVAGTATGLRISYNIVFDAFRDQPRPADGGGSEEVDKNKTANK